MRLVEPHGEGLLETLLIASRLANGYPYQVDSAGW
jgi:hypothetical protein